MLITYGSAIISLLCGFVRWSTTVQAYNRTEGVVNRIREWNGTLSKFLRTGSSEGPPACGCLVAPRICRPSSLKPHRLPQAVLPGQAIRNWKVEPPGGPGNGRSVPVSNTRRLPYPPLPSRSPVSGAVPVEEHCPHAIPVLRSYLDSPAAMGVHDGYGRPAVFGAYSSGGSVRGSCCSGKRASSENGFP